MACGSNHTGGRKQEAAAARRRSSVLQGRVKFTPPEETCATVLTQGNPIGAETSRRPRFLHAREMEEVPAVADDHQVQAIDALVASDRVEDGGLDSWARELHRRRCLLHLLDGITGAARTLACMSLSHATVLTVNDLVGLQPASTARAEAALADLDKNASTEDGWEFDHDAGFDLSLLGDDGHDGSFGWDRHVTALAGTWDMGHAQGGRVERPAGPWAR